MIKVYMGLPSTGTTYDFQNYMLRKIEADYKDKVQLVYPDKCANRIFHDFARNSIVEDFLASDCDILWFLDSDIAPPSHVLDLVTKHGDKWLAAGAPYPVLMSQSGYSGRQITFCVYKGSNGKGLGAADVPDHGTDYVDGLATGCLFLKREVFEKLERPFFEFKYNSTTREPTEGEDLGFCMKLQKLGVSFFVDYSMACKHQKTVDLLEMNNYALEYARISIEKYHHSIKEQMSMAVRQAYKAGMEAGSAQKSRLVLPGQF